MKVKDVIVHILFHVNAESKDSDSSQVAGVAQRSQYVRDNLTSFETDSRELSRESLLEEISTLSKNSTLQTSFKKLLTNIQSDDGIQPQLAIQAWVGKAEEGHG